MGARARALVLEAPRRLVARDVSVPLVSDDDAVLRVEACGLCGTDHEQFTGELWGGFAFIPGHETIGVIDTIGSVAAAKWGVGAGDRVAVEVFQACGACAACARGAVNACHRHGLRDMYGYVDVERTPGLWGGYASHQYLAPDTRVVRVPDGMDPVVATLFNPLGAGIRWAVTLPELQVGARVAILGPGIRGLCALLAVREAGASFVMVTGAGAGDTDRLAVARTLGADLAVDVSADDPIAALRAFGGGPVDLVVDVTAKAPSAFAHAVGLVRTGGTVVIAGTRGGLVDGVPLDVIAYKELRVLGALGVDTASYAAAFGVLQRRPDFVAAVASVTTDLDGAAAILTAMAGDTHAGCDRPIHAVITPTGLTASGATG